MLSRKHYNTIADILQDEIDETRMMEVSKGERVANIRGNRVAAICDVSKALSRYFQQDNPRFNMVKFITASGCLDIIRIGDM
tara:strand:+ start:1476 stop:1721 length:246 start_codon:yes stop_codon:yes gene_type:complete